MRQVDNSLNENCKSAAWDLVGSLFWTQGRSTARPTENEIGIFLEGLATEASIAIVGASTKDLVQAAVSCGLSVTVLDFSPKMCADLAAQLDEPVDVRVQDITAPITAELQARYDAVLSDRLINRFTREETVQAFSGMLALLKQGGSLRTSVKLGLYPMDERMIEEGSRLGTLSSFFDGPTQTIDFEAAGIVLESCLLPHGDIDRDILLNWYRGRGRESRYTDGDIRSLAAKADFRDHTLSLVLSQPFPDAKETTYYAFQKRAQTAV